jgi:hypothetical protein
VFEYAQLFKRFGFLKRCSLPRRELSERFPSKTVYPDVPEKGKLTAAFLPPRILQIGKRKAREPQGIAAGINYNFNEIRAKQVPVIVYVAGQSGKPDLPVGNHVLDESIEDGWLQPKVVGLNVNHDGATQPGGHFGNPVRPGPVPPGGFDDFCPELLGGSDHGFIVGGNNDAVDPLCLEHLPVDVRKKRFAVKRIYHLLRKPL